MRLPGRYDGVARPLVPYGRNEVLPRPCAPVTDFDERLRRLVLDMFASMREADGVGLAANQIGVDARVFVIDCPDARGEDVVGYVINPTLSIPEPVGDEPAEEVTEEGCLSVPGPYAELERAFRARVDGVDVHGERTSIEATGMAARCLQHEVAEVAVEGGNVRAAAVQHGVRAVGDDRPGDAVVTAGQAHDRRS